MTCVYKELFYPQVAVILLPHLILGFFAAKSNNIFLLGYSIFVLLLADFASNVLNNYADWEIDEANKKREELHKRLSKRGIFVLFILMSAALSALLVLSNLYFAFSLMSGFIVGVLYSLGPKLKERFLVNNITIGFTYGFVSYSCGFFVDNTNLGDFFRSIWIPLYCMILIVILSIVKDYEDEIGDREHNVKTFVTLFGKQKTIRFQFFSLTALVLTVIALNLIYRNYFILFSLVPYLLFLKLIDALKKSESPQEYKRIHTKTRCVNVLFILVLLPYVLS